MAEHNQVVRFHRVYILGRLFIVLIGQAGCVKVVTLASMCTTVYHCVPLSTTEYHQVCFSLSVSAL